MTNNSLQIKKYLSPIPFYKKKIICRAPFTSIRLCLNGDIQICCANKEFVLGKYPEVKLHDAWFSKKVKDFRKSILARDLSHGCGECLSQIESGNFASVKASLYKHLPINRNGYPSMIEFELDNTCNLECIMCNPIVSSAINKKCHFAEQTNNPYLHSNILEEIEAFIPFLTHANFIGGEPFLISTYYEIWEKMLAVNKNIRFNISTNGTVLNDKIKNILEKGNFDISVSIDSIRRETYEQIRKNAGFDDVMQNIAFFKNYCKQKKTNFSIWVCPMVINAFEIPELLKYFNNENISVFFNTVTMPHSLSISNLSPIKISEIIDFYAANKVSSPNENSGRFDDLINQLKSWEQRAHSKEAFIKQLENLNADALLELYLSKANIYFDNQNNDEGLKIKLLKNLNLFLADKNEEVKITTLKFFLTLPENESTYIFLNVRAELIDYYVNQYL